MSHPKQITVCCASVKYIYNGDDVRALGAQCGELLSTVVAKNHGQLLTKPYEDGLFSAVFDEAVDALTVARLLIKVFSHDIQKHDRFLKFSFAIHSAERTFLQGSANNPVLNLCTKICSVGKVGELYLTDTTKRLLDTETASASSFVNVGALESEKHQQESIYRLVGSREDIHRLGTGFNTATPSDVKLNQILDKLRVQRFAVVTWSNNETNPFGISRMAIAFLKTFKNAWRIETNLISDPSGLAYSIANAMNIKLPEAVDPIHSLCESISSQQVLLFLDNCDSMFEAYAKQSNVFLEQCPDLAIIIIAADSATRRHHRSEHLKMLGGENMLELAGRSDTGSSQDNGGNSHNLVATSLGLKKKKNNGKSKSKNMLQPDQKRDAIRAKIAKSKSHDELQEAVNKLYGFIVQDKTALTLSQLPDCDFPFNFDLIDKEVERETQEMRLSHPDAERRLAIWKSLNDLDSSSSEAHFRKVRLEINEWLSLHPDDDRIANLLKLLSSLETDRSFIQHT